MKGFPSILILDANGAVVAETGYKKGGAAKYLKHLDKTVKAYPSRREWVLSVETAGDGIFKRVQDSFESASRELASDGRTPSKAEVVKAIAPALERAVSELQTLLDAENAKVLPEKGVPKSVRKERKELLAMIAKVREAMLKDLAEAKNPPPDDEDDDDDED